MKELVLRTFLAGSLLLGSATATLAQNWQLEPTHTQITFSVDHFGISEVSGKFNKFEGGLTATKEDFTDGKGEVTIQVSSIDTDVADRDKHLQAEDFFDAAKFPTIKFVFTSLKKVGDKYEVNGNLTLHGVTKPVKLVGKYKGTAKDPWGGTRAGFLRMEGAINRQDFGIKGGGVMIGDEVRLNISAELLKK
jgi:polyisoprenoid-binding protein YceI